MLWGKGNGLVDKDTGEIKIQVGSRGLGGGLPVSWAPVQNVSEGPGVGVGCQGPGETIPGI